MPAVISHPSSELRRVAWSLLLVKLQAMDTADVTCQDIELVASQVEPWQMAELAVSLVDLLADLWACQYTSVQEAREQASHIALDMAAL